jgi:hypothetical protein
MKGDLWNEMPISANPGARVEPDTIWYGDYQIIGGEYYARSALNDRASVLWTFDRGNGPINPPAPLLHNGAGFTYRDETAGTNLWFRVIDSSLNLGAGVAAPIITGLRSLWVGADEDEATALCWTCGAGYGNDWCQRVESPPLAYNGTGDVSMSFKYFVKAEPCYDGSEVFMRRADLTELLLNPYVGTCTNNPAWDGGFTDVIASYDAPATYSRTITAAEIGGAQNIQIIFEFKSDGGWSDEDSKYCTTYGPFGTDDLSITGGGINRTENWEGGLNGWTPAYCSPIGAFVRVVDIGEYSILDPCSCSLSGNVIAMHDGTGDLGFHPVGQNAWIESPICDFGNSNPKIIFMELEAYDRMPEEDGVLFRPQWEYYPYVCGTGPPSWSGRTGQASWYYGSPTPDCYLARYGGSLFYDSRVGGTPIPQTCTKAKMIVEILADCAAFTIDPCSGQTNFTPLYDNIVVGVAEGKVAPIIAGDIGMTFSDVGSYNPNDETAGALFNPRLAGPANVTVDLYTENDAKPRVSGDTLVITGPVPVTSDPNTRWEARMWWRVAKRSPFNADKENGVDTRYKTWRDKVADGLQIDRPYKPQFTYGIMDSAQLGFIVFRYKFTSTFREDDPGGDFAGEGNPDNEMIWDDALRPGSQIQYFFTGKYVLHPASQYYPDTLGGNFLEFEVLPGLRVAKQDGCGGTGFNYCAFQPSTLYIDAYNGGSQVYIENALRTILNGYDPCLLETGCDIPVDRNWDRYDYIDASSNWKIPFARGLNPGSNNGMTLQQLLGYKAILMNFGTLGAGCTTERDYQLFDQWLISPLCNEANERRVFMMNGDSPGEVLMNSTWPLGYATSFLNNTLGATLFCDSFNGNSVFPACQPPTTDSCVRLMPRVGGPFTTDLDVDMYSNYCPFPYDYDWFNESGGTGNRYYLTESGDKRGDYSQVTNENISSSTNYRTILDAGSWHHMTRRTTDPGNRCPADFPSRVAGSLNEIGAALKWGFGANSYAGIPKLTSAEVLAFCQGTWTLPADVGDNETTLVNRLYQNSPNPFNPQTMIKFSLAQNGPVKVLIYDVSGRLVRTLVDGNLTAGPHTLTWDGTNDAGKHVGSGVFWTQMKAGSFLSNKKMVILK